MKQFKYISIIFFAFTFTLVSCESFVEGINDDPNRPEKADAANMFQGIILANQFWHNGEANRIGMIWMNQATGSDRQYLALNNWNNITASDFDSPWGFAFVSVITQARLASEDAKLSNNLTLQGAIQVLEANSFGTATSLWGDIPFTDVNSGIESPTYENQVDVYNKIQSLLDDAIVNLESGIGFIEEDLTEPVRDIIFEGEVSKWIALAHSLKARYYLHAKDYQNALTEANLGISIATDDVKGIFGSTYGTDMNPFWSFMVFDREGYMDAEGAYAQNLLNPTESDYRGNSKTDETARFNFNYSGNSPSTSGKFGRAADMPLVTYGEMLLIIAEAEARTNGLSAGVTSYNTYRNILNTGYSIGESNSGFGGFSLKYDPYNDSDFQNGGIENSDNIDPTNALLREIYQERYVYFIGHFESFTDFGRTKNIAEIKLKSGFNGTPQRLLYPQTEINSNTSLPGIIEVTVPTTVNN